MPAETPNIVIILADDLGYGDISCYTPESKVQTPYVDQLAKEGMRFTDAHSPSTVCTPTRYSILTGRMAFRNGMRGVFTGAGGPCLIEEGRLGDSAPCVAGLEQHFVQVDFGNGLHHPDQRISRAGAGVLSA